VDHKRRLELRRELGGLRHYLDGAPIHCGDLLEMRTDDGAWVVVRYEWNQRVADTASLICSDNVLFDLDPATHLRWPEGVCA